MRIISIDVGIKNLAYCVFYNGVEAAATIEKWGVVDLSQQSQSSGTEVKILCSCVTTTKGTKKNPSIQKQCSSAAKWRRENEYYCVAHVKKTAYLIPTSQLKLSYFKKQNMTSLKKIIVKYGLVIDENKMKKADLVSLLDAHIQKNILEPIITNTISVNATTLDLVTIGKNLKTKFDDLFNDLHMDRVIIENQISPIANRMKTIQGMIAQYFIMKTMDNEKLIIDFVSSANKLKFSPHNIPHTIPVVYKERKALGIQYVGYYLTDSNWLSFFNKYGNKKDDLADCYLQGIWYIQNKI